MKTNINLNLTMIVLAVLGVAATFYFGRKGIAAAAGAVGNAVDPTNNDNIFARGVNAVGGAIAGADDGNSSWSLGSKLQELDQWVVSKITGAPTDNELVQQQPKIQPRMRELDGVER